MSLVGSHVDWCPPVTVALVEEGLGDFGLLFNQEVMALLSITFLRENPNVLEQLTLDLPLLFYVQFLLTHSLLFLSLGSDMALSVLHGRVVCLQVTF